MQKYIPEILEKIIGFENKKLEEKMEKLSEKIKIKKNSIQLSSS